MSFQEKEVEYIKLKKWLNAPFKETVLLKPYLRNVVTGKNQEMVWAEFSSLCLAALLYTIMILHRL